MTVFQLEQKLRNKGYKSEEIGVAIKKLIAWGYLDDYSYARTFIKTRKKELSAQRIYTKLLKVGIDKEIIRELLEKIYPEELEYQNCLKLADVLCSKEYQKWRQNYCKNPKYNNISPKTYLYRKVGNKLLYRGYRSEVVYAVLSEILKEKIEKERL